MLTDKKHRLCRPELWGGIECTINRIGDNYYDQLEAGGHYYRDGDIRQIAKLGITALRYPLLWERHKPFAADKIDWDFTTSRLNDIRDNGMQVIAGLVHHGSGPAYTSLADPEFGQKLAAYAGEVAEQFPWIDKYTPVNEPLTTARFSGLYGFWYPHAANDHDFCMMMLNQMEGVVRSMQVIRKINPDAQLIQTEDLSQTHSTPLLKYQAKFENEKRWLTFDLLTGRVDNNHYLWKYFMKSKVPESRLRFFQENICPPDILGANYYVTSERFLDENIDAYPVHTHGGNDRHTYADIEAVRSSVSERVGVTALLKEAWQRFEITPAITECHLHCAREEQMRWLDEIWKEAGSLADNGIPVKAVTAWALLGAFDWDSLLTQQNGNYESGVFELGNNRLRSTALAPMLKSLAVNGTYEHHLLEQVGWWHKKDRYLNGYNEIQLKTESAKSAIDTVPLIISGPKSPLLSAFVNACLQRSIHVILMQSRRLSKGDEGQLLETMDFYRGWGIVTFGENDFQTEIPIVNCLSRKGKLSLTVPVDFTNHGKFINRIIDLMIDGVTGEMQIVGAPAQFC